ncbi:MAG: hypothetical protein COA42_23430 [Alteromonadaceae bacterium]|nr:MAG: hypothetical protein COA42_23430 [Alteromonadaceae bacterium]
MSETKQQTRQALDASLVRTASPEEASPYPTDNLVGLLRQQAHHKQHQRTPHKLSCATLKQNWVADLTRYISRTQCS